MFVCIGNNSFNRLSFAWLLLCVFISFPISSAAQFTFNFDDIDGAEPGGFDCGTGGDGGPGCTGGPSTAVTDRYVQEWVTIDGERYMHQVLGSLESGFALEVFLLQGKMGPQCPDMSCITDGRPTQNLAGVAIKQVTSATSGDNTFYDEFLKDRLDYKGKVHQIINWDALNFEFEVDARSQLLAVMPIESVPVTNQMTINSPGVPPSILDGMDFTDFDMNVDNKQLHSVGSSYYYDEATNTVHYLEF